MTPRRPRAPVEPRRPSRGRSVAVAFGAVFVITLAVVTFVVMSEGDDTPASGETAVVRPASTVVVPPSSVAPGARSRPAAAVTPAPSPHSEDIHGPTSATLIDVARGAEPDATFIGVVFAADGMPVGRATVEYVAEARRDDDRDVRDSARTDEAGRFALTCFTDTQIASATLSITSGQHAPLTVSCAAPSDTTQDLGTFILAPGARVAGRILHASGDPAVGTQVSVVVHAESTKYVNGHRREAFAGADGTFLVGGLPAGQALVSLRPHNRRLLHVLSLALATGEHVDIGTRTIPPGEILTGSVRDAGGLPIADAVVFLMPTGGGEWSRDPGRSTTTDDAGTFAFEGIDPGPYDFKVWRADIEHHVTNIDIPCAPVHVVVGRAASIDLLLTALADMPLEDVEVEAWALDERGRTPRRLPVGEVVPRGDDRTVTIDGVTAIGTRVTVRADGFGHVEIDLPGVQPSGTLSHTLGLDAAARIAGLVTDWEGHPTMAHLLLVKTQSVLGRLPSPFMHAGGPFATQAGQGGTWSLDAVPAGHWTLVAAPSGGPKTTLDLGFVAAGEELSDVHVVLAGVGGVEGVLLDADGEPIVGESIRCRAAALTEPAERLRWNRERLSDDVESTTTDADGAWSIRGLAAGAYTVEAYTRGPTSERGTRARSAPVPAASATVAVHVGDTTFVTLRRAPTSAVTGVVRATGVALDGARVVLWRALSHKTSGVTTTPDEAGRFAFHDVDPGPWTVQVELPDAGDYPSEDLVVSPGVDRHVEFEVDEGSIGGRVVVASTGRPAAAHIRAALHVDGEPRRGSSDAGTEAGPDGQFVLRAVGPGTWTVTAETKGWATASSVVTLEPGQALTDVRLEFLPGSRITGRVENPDGSPRSGCFVFASLPGASVNTYARADASGSFAIEDLAPGEWRLSVAHIGPPLMRADETVTVTDGVTTSVTLVLHE